MQFTQFSPFSTQSENEVTITPPSSNSENRRQVWSIEDDKMLARAHSTIGQDGKVGNEQKGLTFWKRIEKYYNDNHPNGGPKRTQQKLKAHWGHVVTKTRDFNAIYCKLQGMRPSGASDADLVVRALEEYKQKNGTEQFGYEHVWAIVKDLPSWQPQFVARQISLNTSSTNQTSSGSVAGAPTMGSDEVFPRPMGKKHRKEEIEEQIEEEMMYNMLSRRRLGVLSVEIGCLEVSPRLKRARQAPVSARRLSDAMDTDP
nr:glutathione S-transferase T3-like [Ipomoea batatas]